MWNQAGGKIVFFWLLLWGVPEQAGSFRKNFLEPDQIWIGTTMGSDHDFLEMLELVDTRIKSKPIIDSVYSFDSAVEGIWKMRDGRAIGKIVIEPKVAGKFQNSFRLRVDFVLPVLGQSKSHPFFDKHRCLSRSFLKLPIRSETANEF